ncbi:MAG: hypothetical protein J6B63_06185 [Treponema sp.]|nr:hypothetical protein [Treponema sp.]
MKNKNKAILIGTIGTAVTVGGLYACVNKISKDLKGLDVNLDFCDGRLCCVCSDSKNCNNCK